MTPVLTKDISGTWTFTPEGGAPAPITVPGGGWLKQGFSCDAGTYETWITIPEAGFPQVTKLQLGAVNHIAEYWLGASPENMVKIHEDVTAFTHQTVDLTPYVKPGETCLLQIFVRAWQDDHAVAPHCADWCECIARGIFRSAELLVYPEVYVRDIFVKTSVEKQELSCEVTVTNASDALRSITLKPALSSPQGTNWAYPTLSPISVTLLPGETKTLFGSAPWELGSESFWFPNVPYTPGYRAVLHLLTVSLSENGAPVHKAAVRFGFRELRQVGRYYELNGTRVNFRGDNLQAANYDRIDNGGRGDAIDTLPGFLPPSAENPGWPKAVDNFLRLNYNVQREHMCPWTPYMLDVCDEMGLMLIGESACRWEGFDMLNGRGYHEVKCLQDIIRRDRNHPSIVRWSSKNEAQCTDPAYHLELYEAIKALDDTRPIHEDYVYIPGGVLEPDRVFPLVKNKPDFTWIDHYLCYDAAGKPAFNTIDISDVIQPMDRPFGMSEANWMRSSTPAGLAWFAATIALGRARDASDLRPYVLLSSWVSSVPGVKTTDLLTEEVRHPLYGEDNLPDPWANPGIRLLQNACHPLFAMDYDFWWLNRRSDAFGHFPVVSPKLPAKSRVTRNITVFNDEFSAGDILLRWDVREGSLSNWVCASGEVPLSVAPGEHKTVPVTFPTPRYNSYVFLTLTVVKNGEKRYTDSYSCYEVTGGEDFSLEINGEARVFL